MIATATARLLSCRKRELVVRRHKTVRWKASGTAHSSIVRLRDWTFDPKTMGMMHGASWADV